MRIMYSQSPPSQAYWVWLEEIGGRSTIDYRAGVERKMTETHSSSPSGSPFGPPSSVLQQKLAAESSPTDRVERLLRKYKVDKIILYDGLWQLENYIKFLYFDSLVR